MKKALFFSAAFLVSVILSAQTFTMGKSCRQKNADGIALLKDKQYQEALNQFDGMAGDCKTKDAREAIAIGRAEALNGLGKYEEAIEASNAALKVTKNKSLGGNFQKAVALGKLKRYDEASATFGKVIALTEKNKDTKTRASNYALISMLHWRALGSRDSADYFLEKAISLDPTNPDFILQKGDMMAGEKNYDAAFEQYDKAMGMGKVDEEMYTIRSNTRLRMLQEKYNTTNTQELRGKMTPQEKSLLCADLTKAISLGLRDMKHDMFASLVCK